MTNHDINIKITTRADGKGFDVTTTGLKEVSKEARKTTQKVGLVDKSINKLTRRLAHWGSGLF